MAIRVQEYVREDGSMPFKEWFDGLDPEAAAKVAAAGPAEPGQYLQREVVQGPWRVRNRLGSRFGGGTKRRQQRDIDRAKELLAEYEARKSKLKKRKPSDERRRGRKGY